MTGYQFALAVGLSTTSLALGALRADALTLVHNDLVALQSTSGTETVVVRIDGTTGAQETIATAPSMLVDAAIEYGGKRIYTVDRAGSLAAIDPSTGNLQVVTSGFIDPVGVAVNRSGDVFVLDNGSPVEPDAYFGVPVLYRIDSKTGASEEVVRGSLPLWNDPSGEARWGGLDLEIIGDSSLVTIALNHSDSRPNCCGGRNLGMVLLDPVAGTAETLFTAERYSNEGGGDLLDNHSGFGVTTAGDIIMPGDWSENSPVHYSVLDDTFREPYPMELLYDEDGDWFGGLNNVTDTTQTPNGQLYVSHWSIDTPPGVEESIDQIGIQRVVEGACPTCSYTYGAQLVGGRAFSSGKYFEIQPVVIPEPATALSVGLGLVVLGARRMAGRG